MMWIVSTAGDKDVSEKDFKDLIKAVALSGAQCASYIGPVGEIAKSIGACDTSKLFFLDRFAKTLGENKTLGEEFLTSVSKLMVSKTDKCNMTQAACIACNLVSDKVVDGISKLITKNDVDRLKSQPKKAETMEVERMLTTAWSMVTKTLENHLINEEDFDSVIGMFMVRVILHVSDKAKFGPEGRTFKNLREIKNQFSIDLLNRAGEGNIDLGSWAPTLHEEGQREAAQPSTTSVMRSMEQQKDPTQIANDNGFVVGDFVHEKGTTGHVFKIQSLGEKVRLCKFDLYGVNPLVVDIPFSTFIESWLMHKSKLTQILLLPEEPNAQTDIDELRCIVFAALSKADEFVLPLQYMIYPSSISATQDINKGELKLAPMTLLSYMSIDKKGGSVAIKVGEKTVYVTAPPKPDKDADLEKYLFVPFWWVEKTDRESCANMKLASLKVNDVIMPVLQNIRAIKKHENLCMYKPKEARVSLAGAEVVNEPPKKKGRTSTSKAAKSK